MSKQQIEFNINNYVRVKLNDNGYQLLADLNNRLVEFGRKSEVRDAQYYKEQADNEGYTRFQAWCFMQQFGEVIIMGGKEYFDPNILIEVADKLEGERNKYLSELLPDDKEIEAWLMLTAGGGSPESGNIRDDMRRGAKWMRENINDRLRLNY